MSRESPNQTSVVSCASEHTHHASASQAVFDARAFERAAQLFRAAGDVPRLKLLERLSRGECCVSEIADEMGEGLSTISQRLRLLRSEGLVQRRREGKHVYYAVADQHVASLIHTALAHASEDSPPLLSEED